MSNIPAELRYASTHEWVRPEGDGTFTVGISEHAQELLGDMVFIELPDVGAEIAAGDDVAVANRSRLHLMFMHQLRVRSLRLMKI